MRIILLVVLELLVLRLAKAGIFQCPNARAQPPSPTGHHQAHAHEGLKLTDFLHVIITNKKMHGRVRGARPWRLLGIPALVLTDVAGVELNALNLEGAQFNELWIQGPEGPTPDNPVLRCAAAPFMVPDTPYMGKFKWIFFGDDDTLINFFALRHTLRHWDSDLPYVVTDGFLQTPISPHQDQYSSTFSGGYAPRCLPCHLARDPILSNLLRVPGRGNFTPALGCPCTPELACSQRPVPDLERLSTNGVPNVTACMEALRITHSTRQKSIIFGGYGSVYSRGLFRCHPFSNATLTLQLMKDFLTLHPEPGGDALDSDFLAELGVWITDPGNYWWSPIDTEISAFGGTAMGGVVSAAQAILQNDKRAWAHFQNAISEHYHAEEAEIRRRTELVITAWRMYSTEQHHA